MKGKKIVNQREWQSTKSGEVFKRFIDSMNATEGMDFFPLQMHIVNELIGSIQRNRYFCATLSNAHRICRNKRPGRLIFRSSKKTFQKPPPPKIHRFYVLPPLKNHPSKPIGFVYSPLWKITVFAGRLFRQKWYFLLPSSVWSAVWPARVIADGSVYRLQVYNQKGTCGWLASKRFDSASRAIFFRFFSITTVRAWSWNFAGTLA